MLEPKTGLLAFTCVACLPHCPAREREAQGATAEASTPRASFLDSPPHALASLQSAALLAGVRIPPPRLPPPRSISQPISLGVYTGSAVHPSPASGAAQGEAGRLQRPTRAPRP